jgi:hypothetical protein
MSRGPGGGVHRRQGEGNKVVYSVVWTKAKNPAGREEVENHFEGEPSEKQQQN